MKGNHAMNGSLLIKVREAVPFLREIPDDVYLGLDPGEWHIPQGAIADARSQLEEALNEHVMTYRRDLFLKDIPIERHLCARLAGAELDEARKKVLEEYENRFRDAGVSFVVYKKPVTVIPVEDSYIFKPVRD